MSFAVLHQSDTKSLMFSGVRIGRLAFRELVASDELICEARNEARSMREDAARGSAEQFERAREEGFAQGRAEGISAVLGTLEIEARMRDLLTTQIAALVEQCVRNILADIGPEEVFRRRVNRLIRNVADVGACKLHVAPGQAHLVHSMLDAHRQEGGADMRWLAVVSDETCARDALVLETQVGFIDASLDLTLASMGDIVRRAVERAAAQLER